MNTAEKELKCLRLGCLKKYKESENSDTSCTYHCGKPIFHDLKKGWTCCNQIVYDWDEFQKLKGCQVGRHSNVKPNSQKAKVYHSFFISLIRIIYNKRSLIKLKKELSSLFSQNCLLENFVSLYFTKFWKNYISYIQKNLHQGQGAFFQSNTVNRAAKGLEKNPYAPKPVKQVPKSIDQYNKEQKAQQVKIEPKKEEEKPLFYTKNNKLRCINKGCSKEYDESENGDQACEYHSGAPVFHDLKKYWTCCKKETWDWDEFMKLPKCMKGRHVPKRVK